VLVNDGGCVTLLFVGVLESKFVTYLGVEVNEFASIG
jgi:hypothetical protein